MLKTRLDLDRIHAARRVIDPIFLDTPLYQCDALGRHLGCSVSVKLETANPVRSFKARGTELVASLLSGEGRTAVVCASAGNLGQALGWSGRRRGLDVTVVAVTGDDDHAGEVALVTAFRRFPYREPAARHRSGTPGAPRALGGSRLAGRTQSQSRRVAV